MLWQDPALLVLLLGWIVYDIDNGDFPRIYCFMPIAAFAGALLATLLVYFIAKKTGASRIAIVLSGARCPALLVLLRHDSYYPADAAISRTSF